MWELFLASSTVEQELMELPPEMKARLLKVAELIKTHGLPNVGMPYVRHIQDELWEIRLAGKDAIGRGLYVTLAGKRIVILRFFVKKTRKTPGKEIRTALERLRSISDETLRGIEGRNSKRS
ncbi:protein of unknown function DUF891 [Desulfonatronospira thiodismutans ASO3-1]|uniref:Phage-related protein n=1 Tax=Desulfonatronospira thiodismutans ASO3-1 TaxID=555779 RepID=D6SSL6_9BACT|nr:type II toxin-antitoxin system RelE/ParE family toxin [Desulfonatronospira thiodismutans]EFI33682.1 protein of unknown function DUF891 [Desulfonatronospira thiodismutans ASO3-1]